MNIASQIKADFHLTGTDRIGKERKEILFPACVEVTKFAIRKDPVVPGRS